MNLQEFKTELKKKFPSREEGSFNGFMERCRLYNIQPQDVLGVLDKEARNYIRKEEKRQREIANRNGLFFMRRDNFFTLAGMANIMLDVFIKRGYKYNGK